MIDKEGWYSVTPEPFARYLARRVKETFKSEETMDIDGVTQYDKINVLDGFGGIGGNLI